VARRRKGDRPSGIARVVELLAEAPPGLHELELPASALPAGLPEPLIELYACCDGGRVFLDAIELAPVAEVAQLSPGRWRFAAVDGDAVALDARGRVWRFDPSLDDDVLDGTLLDRWLAGIVDATALLYDRDGEFAEDAFDDDGEIAPAIRERQLRAQLRRDPAAPGPRWRLALALRAQGATESARDELEQVVADEPAFAWAWLDLARISEELGELGGAIDEARMGAQTAEGARHAQAGYFWAQVARLARRAGDEPLRAEAATRTSLLAPTLRRAQIDGARDCLAGGDPASARGLVELLLAVWPRDLEVLALARDASALRS
jgi:tetratricopeptide (TPR) repeat protein